MHLFILVVEVTLGGSLTSMALPSMFQRVLNTILGHSNSHFNTISIQQTARLLCLFYQLAGRFRPYPGNPREPGKKYSFFRGCGKIYTLIIIPGLAPYNVYLTNTEL